MINCRPDGANTSAVYYCRGFTRLRLVTPLPKPWSLLTELSPDINNFNLFLAIFLYPYFSDSLAPVGSFAAWAHDMNMTPVFGCISRENGEDKTENDSKFAHIIDVCFLQR